MDSISDNNRSGFAALVKEVCNSWGGPVGDFKEVEKVTREGDIVTDPATGSARTTVFVHSEAQEGGAAHTHPHVAFDVSLSDLERLAEEAPYFKTDFGRMRDAVAARLETDTEAYRQTLDWQANGMPTQRPTKIMPRLRFKSPA